MRFIKHAKGHAKGYPGVIIVFHALQFGIPGIQRDRDIIKALAKI